MCIWILWSNISYNFLIPIVLLNRECNRLHCNLENIFICFTCLILKLSLTFLLQFKIKSQKKMHQILKSVNFK